MEPSRAEKCEHQVSFNQQIDNSLRIVQRIDQQTELEQEFELQEEAGVELDGYLTDLQYCLFSDGSEQQHNRDDQQISAKYTKITANHNKMSVYKKSSQAIKLDITEK
ncbi:hypothetical protein OXYTRIMIC_707 [Oxytricha trifallax]|uniref:Uncharacterized protein n=1 Tax=Oxytricha trifallax TaxID=1172189 RepID=A0A073HZQ8_9SPIT|nr:hypothetical protein OXYTRIMIC_707 [Oxytricha trifallax]